MPPADLGASCAEHLLDAGIDVGAVEGRDAGIAKRNEIVDRRFAVDRDRGRRRAASRRR